MIRSAGHPKWPLAPFIRKIYPFLPLVAALGLLAGLLEGAGIGLFIPLLAILLSDSLPSGLPEPIRALASLFNHYDPQARAILLGAAIFGLIILKGVVQAANECLVASIAGRVGRDIRNALARTLLTLDYPFFLKHSPARLTRIMSTDSWSARTTTSRAAMATVPAE